MRYIITTKKDGRSYEVKDEMSLGDKLIELEFHQGTVQYTLDYFMDHLTEQELRGGLSIEGTTLLVTRLPYDEVLDKDAFEP